MMETIKPCPRCRGPISPSTGKCSRGCGYIEERAIVLPPLTLATLPPLPPLPFDPVMHNRDTQLSDILPPLPSLAVAPPREAATVQPARVLLVDFPWAFDDKGQAGGRGAEQHYKVMTIDQLKAFPIPPLHELCVGFFWRVEALGKACYDVVESWGFETKSKITWRKTLVCKACAGRGWAEFGDGPVTGIKAWCEQCHGRGYKLAMGMGRYTRRVTEDCIIAVRKGAKASKCHPVVKDVRDIFDAPRSEHSAKPDKLYEIIERMYPGGPYTELFARRRRAGWQQFGDELPPEGAQ